MEQERTYFAQATRTQPPSTGTTTVVVAKAPWKVVLDNNGPAISSVAEDGIFTANQQQSAVPRTPYSFGVRNFFSFSNRPIVSSRRALSVTSKQTVTKKRTLPRDFHRPCAGEETRGKTGARFRHAGGKNLSLSYFTFCYAGLVGNSTNARAPPIDDTALMFTPRFLRISYSFLS